MITPDRRLGKALLAALALAAGSQAISPPSAVSAENPNCPSQITVKSGDTFSGIAVKRCQMRVSDLAALNPHITDPNKIWPGNVIYTAPGPNTGGPVTPEAKPVTVATHPDGLSPFEPLSFMGNPVDVALGSGKVAWYKIDPEAVNGGSERTRLEINADLPPKGDARIRLFAYNKIPNALADGCPSENNTGALTVRQDNVNWDPIVHMRAAVSLLNREGPMLMCVDNVSGGSQTTRIWFTKLQ